VVLHRREADHQPLGNLGVVEALNHQPQHLPLALGQRLGLLRLLIGAHQRLRGLGGEGHLAVPGRADGRRQLAGGHILHQVAHGAGLQRVLHQLILLEAGQRDDLDVRMLALDRLRGSYAVHHRHHQVHQDNIGLEQPRARHRLLPVLGLAHEFEVGVNT